MNTHLTIGIRTSDLKTAPYATFYLLPGPLKAAILMSGHTDAADFVVKPFKLREVHELV